MKSILLFISIIVTSCIFSQSVKSKSVRKNSFKVTIRFKNTDFDSLKLNHYVSTDNGNKPDLIRDLPKKKYTFKITEGEYHTIWVTNANIHKGLFIEGYIALLEFDLELNLLNPDVLNVYWNKEEEQYYMSRLNYEEMMNSFKVE